MGKLEAELSNVLEKRNSDGSLQRKLKSRHLTMMAIGGAIGTGLFVSSGSTISTAGPGGALAAFILVGIMVYFVMNSLGELSAFLPVPGAFDIYASKYVDPALGFALGWNYWYTTAITVPADLVASTLIMKYWFPNVSSLLWSALFLGLLLILNVLSVKAFGESEYWFASIKVISIIVFLVIGVAMIFGIMGGHAVGLSNFTQGDAPFHGGLISIFSVVLVAGFAFQGTEVIATAAGETDNPSKNVPKAIRSIFWRILIFYVLTIFVIGLIIPYTDPNLLKSGVQNVSISPFTLVLQRAGLAFAASVMNAVLLTSVLSAANSAMYASSRMLWALAKEGKAPRIFAQLNRKGIPMWALCTTAILGLVSFLASLFGNGSVFIWLVNASALTGFIKWFGIAVSHYRFRKAYVAQGRDLNELPFKAKWYPLGPVITLLFFVVFILGQNLFSGHQISWAEILATYIGLPIFLLLWLGYKIIKKTKVVPLMECDFERKES
ncbi:gamma-aminobutyrate permease [Bacillus sp. AFS018417]|uniref:amino acid permease n=1 Tax=unclassified Bacillus (in: firmicutes) TaxID=185979 RepID=UPI000BF56108|nr:MULTISPECIES: amino acid permease [unclassified Bacillus (in: firmicutes)]MCP1124020.1 amino acid permease [Bacillus sp. 3103sda1]PEZ07006.1 gamma-aminobutyrate permease [Bacillus sp. AFS018417]